MSVTSLISDHADRALAAPLGRARWRNRRRACWQLAGRAPIGALTLAVVEQARADAERDPDAAAWLAKQRASALLAPPRARRRLGLVAAHRPRGDDASHERPLQRAERAAERRCGGHG